MRNRNNQERNNKYLQTEFLKFLIEKSEQESKTHDKSNDSENQIETSDIEDMREDKIKKLNSIRKEDRDENAEEVIENLLTLYNKTRKEYEDLFERRGRK